MIFGFQQLFSVIFDLSWQLQRLKSDDDLSRKQQQQLQPHQSQLHQVLHQVHLQNHHHQRRDLQNHHHHQGWRKQQSWGAMKKRFHAKYLLNIKINVMSIKLKYNVDLYIKGFFGDEYHRHKGSFMTAVRTVALRFVGTLSPFGQTCLVKNMPTP